MWLYVARLASRINEDTTVFGSLNHLDGGRRTGWFFSIPRWWLTILLLQLLLELLDGGRNHLLQRLHKVRLLALVPASSTFTSSLCLSLLFSFDTATQLSTQPLLMSWGARVGAHLVVRWSRVLASWLA